MTRRIQQGSWRKRPIMKSSKQGWALVGHRNCLVSTRGACFIHRKARTARNKSWAYLFDAAFGKVIACHTVTQEVSDRLILSYGPTMSTNSEYVRRSTKNTYKASSEPRGTHNVLLQPFRLPLHTILRNEAGCFVVGTSPDVCPEQTISRGRVGSWEVGQDLLIAHLLQSPEQMQGRQKKTHKPPPTADPRDMVPLQKFGAAMQTRKAQEAISEQPLAVIALQYKAPDLYAEWSQRK